MRERIRLDKYNDWKKPVNITKITMIKNGIAIQDTHIECWGTGK